MTGIEADQLGRRLSIHLRKNNFEACRDVLDEVEKERAKKRARPLAFLGCSQRSRLALAETRLDMRWVNLLEEQNIMYVDQLRGKNIDKLCHRIRNMGPRAVTAIKIALNAVKEDELCSY